MELAEIRNDKPCRRGRRRCADIRGEVAERGVLLVADRGNDRDREGGDCTDEPFVAEGQEILEAAAAAGDDDDVELRHLAEAAQRVYDRARGARALDVGLGHDDMCRWKPGLDPGQDIALRGRVVASDEPDLTRPDGQCPLPLGREQAFRRQLPLQALQCRQVVA